MDHFVLENVDLRLSLTLGFSSSQILSKFLTYIHIIISQRKTVFCILSSKETHAIKVIVLGLPWWRSG